MSEFISEQTDIKPVEKTETVQESEAATKQPSAVEQRALDQGWRPKEEFEGDENEFIDAAEFVRRGELFSKIEHQSKEVKQLRQALEAFKVHHTNVKASEFKRALKQIDAARRQAVVDGEHDRAFALEDKMEEIKEEKAQFDAEIQQVSTAPVAPHTDPVWENWQASNSWYGKDKAMTALADELGKEYRAEVLAGNLSKDQVFDKIAKEVKTEFKHKFQNNKTSRPAAVESSSRGGRSNYSDSFQMSDDERSIMRKIVKTGIMTEAQYLKELKSQKEV